MRILRLIPLLAFACFLPGACVLAGSPGTVLLSGLYNRTTNTFARACLFKPVEAGATDLSFTLAPLILQEVVSPELDGQDVFGGLVSQNGEPCIDHSIPTVYVKSDTVQANGAAHVRLAYVWYYTTNLTDGVSTASSVQGVRITLDSSGRPKIWEILGDTSSAKLIFVSQSVEAAALEQYGPPLPGRRYAAERKMEECPNIVVPRVIEDGPAVMGPIIYLCTRTKSVSTVICRCMPAQAKELVSTINYRLVPFEGIPLLLSNSKASRDPGNSLWPELDTTGGDLQKMLRLPSSF